MPRKSAAALAIVTPITEHRPPPPEGLTEAQAEEWRAIVARMPSSWFPRETHGLLVAYVKHVSAHRVLSDLVDSFEPVWLSRDDGLTRYDKLLQMREREARALSSLATRMRMTQQSQYAAQKANTAVKNARPADRPPPWEPIR
jgi:hypothetical protein